MDRGQSPRRQHTFVRALCAVAIGLGALTAAPAAAEEPDADQRLDTFELASPLIDTSTPGGRLEGGRTAPKVNVLLPEDYDEHPEREYPVLWLLHGANGGTDTWLPGIRTLADGLPAVIVMPDGGVLGMYTDWWNGGARANPSWATYHLRTLKDEIESRYRIRPQRRWHAIAGISMGGQGALRYAGQLPGYFGSVAALSGALPNMQSAEAQAGLTLLPWVNPAAKGVGYTEVFGAGHGAYAAGNSPRALAGNYAHTRLYMTAGNGWNCPADPINPNSYLPDAAVEVVINAQQYPFKRAVEAAGADATARTTCGVHTFGVWDRAFAAARSWGFFEPVPERPRSWSYRTAARSGQMWALDFRFAEPPSDLATFTRSGATLSATGSGEVRISGPRDCELTATLPFTQRLPKACR